MNSFKSFLISASILMVLIGCTSQKPMCDSLPVSHEIFDELLRTHVTTDGEVDYKGFISDSIKFNQYLEIIESNHPTRKWNKNERLAYWINAYNAFTIRLIIRNYPVESIKDLGGSIYQINTPWDINFIEICGVSYNLNNIEHGKIRKQFHDPRIHFAVNCASLSCPKLYNQAFIPNILNNQLDEVTQSFLDNSTKNVLSADSSRLSKIFKWYARDFKKSHKTVINFINQYSSVQLSDKTEIEYQNYSWILNDKRD